MTAASSMAATVIANIKKGTLNPTNAIDIVKHVADLVRGDREAAIEILSVVARGPDGISGTTDDVFPPATLSQIRTLLDNDLVGHLTTALATPKKFSCC